MAWDEVIGMISVGAQRIKKQAEAHGPGYQSRVRLVGTQTPLKAFPTFVGHWICVRSSDK